MVSQIPEYNLQERLWPHLVAGWITLPSCCCDLAFSEEKLVLQPTDMTDMTRYKFNYLIDDYVRVV